MFKSKAKQKFFNPFAGMTFEDAFDAETAFGMIKQNVLHSLARELNPHGKTQGSIEVTDIIFTPEEMFVKLSKSEKVSARLRKIKSTITAESKLITIKIDRKTGKIIEDSEKLFSSRGAVNFAKCTSLMVNLAHLVSDWDNAKNLKKIESKLDQMVEHNRRTLLARLRTEFESLNESLSTGEENYDQNRLRAIKHHIKGLRHEWVMELKDKLRQIKENSEQRESIPDLASKVINTFIGNPKQNFSLIDNEAVLLRLLIFAFRMEMTVAEVLGEWDLIATCVLPQLRSDLTEVHKTLRILSAPKDNSQFEEKPLLEEYVENLLSSLNGLAGQKLVA